MGGEQSPEAKAQTQGCSSGFRGTVWLKQTVCV